MQYTTNQNNGNEKKSRGKVAMLEAIKEMRDAGVMQKIVTETNQEPRIKIDFRPVRYKASKKGFIFISSCEMWRISQSFSVSTSGGVVNWYTSNSV